MIWTNEPGSTQKLVDFVLGMRPEALPANVLERAKDLLLDHFGVALYGASLEWSRIVREQALAEGGNAESTIYGSDRVTARNAAMANGTAAHAIELDDTHDESLNHPGCVVIPAALAVAEFGRISGPRFLAAMVAGYEAQCRVGSALSKTLIRKGLHPTAQTGTFGSAAAVGHVLDLSPRELTSAFGIAASMTSGVMQFTQDPEGTMIKRLHAGMPAERGLLAAELAAAGFTGPRAAIEGTYGFAQVFAGEQDLSRLTRDLGQRFEIESISVKLYPCCRMFHSLIDAIEECCRDPAFVMDEIDGIDTFGPRNMIDGHLERRPRSTMAAQYSLPYTTAAAIVLDPSAPASFEADAMERPDVLALADKVQPEFDPELEALFPKQFSSRVRFRFTDGRVVERTVLDSRSTPAKPLGRDGICEKFLGLTAELLSKDQQYALIDAVMALDRAESLRDVVALLGRGSLGAVEPTRHTA